MALPVCLVRRHNHLTALSALSLIPEKPIFPAVMTCPLCHAPDLYLFDDTVTDGIWFHCETCRAHGDIITFGAQIWNTSTVDALSRFVALGAANSSETNRLSGEYLRALTRLNAGKEFWAETEGQVWNHHDDVIACRVRELGLEEASTGCRGLVGVAHHDQITAFCKTIGRAAPARMRENGPSLVFPFYDLPGRMTGLLLIQYSEEFMSRRVFIPLAGSRNQKSDAGCFLLHTVLAPAIASLRNSYFVSDDLFWVVNAQATNIKSGQGLLPLAGFYSGPEARSVGLSWPAFGHQPRFFHAAHVTPDTVTQAANAKGYVCALAPAAVYTPPNPVRTLSRLAAIRKTAQTWQTALEKTLKASNETAAQSFVTRLGLDIGRLQDFLGRQTYLHKDFAARLLAHVENAPAIPTKLQRSWTILERDGGWWAVSGTHVANGQVVIEKIVHGDNGARLYVGHIKVAGREIRFADSADKIENIGLLAFAAQLAAAEKTLLIFNRKWNAHAHVAALKLHPPEIVHVSGQSGWNPRTNEFCFYRYSLANDGQIKFSSYPEINPQRTADFPPPGPVAPITIRALLTPSYENAYLWTVFATVAANLLAPIVGRPARPAACLGDNFLATESVCSALDCVPHKITAAQRTNVARFLATTTASAEWPVLAAHTFNDVQLCRTPVTVPAGQLLARLAPVTALMAPGYGWQLLRGAQIGAPPDVTAMRHVLPSYIQTALERRMRVAERHPDLTAAVLTDLADWLKDIYDAAFNLPYALNHLTAEANAHETLMEAVNTGIAAGKLSLLPRPRSKEQANSFLLRNKRHWWLNQRAIDRYCVAVGGLAPNWLAITDRLKRADVFYGDNSVHDMPGFLVCRDWCDQFWVELKESRELG
jgi:hypothetical protein